MDLGKQKLDKRWIDKRITYSAYYDVNREGKEKKLRWVGGLILDVSDGTWLMQGARMRCYAENEVAYFCRMRLIAPCASQLSLSKNISLTRCEKGLWKKEDEIYYGY